MQRLKSLHAGHARRPALDSRHEQSSSRNLKLEAPGDASQLGMGPKSVQQRVWKSRNATPLVLVVVEGENKNEKRREEEKLFIKKSPVTSTKAPL